MGIRIHKVIGYGVTNVKTKGYNIADPRIDTEKFNELSNESWNVSPADFVKWAAAHREEILALRRREFPHHSEETWQVIKRSSLFGIGEKATIKHLDAASKKLSSHVVYGTEYMLSRVMLFQPFGCAESWSRYDDTIDYFEETYRKRQANWVKVPKGCPGIYPYNSGWIRYRPAGSAVSSDLKAKQHLVPADYAMLLGTWDPKLAVGRATGADFKDIEENWRPSLPSELLAVMLWFGPAFRDLLSFIDELRPMLYCYWS